MKLPAILLAAALALPAQAQTRPFVTHHVADLAAGRVNYAAMVESFDVSDGAHDKAATLVATSYLREAIPADTSRPVVFMFNGGPSAAAIGLHMELGPVHARDKRAAQLVFETNQNTLLDVADLVAFDPVETGYSRVTSTGDLDWFYSTDGDADALAQLVTAWLKAHKRTGSPVYLLGESYGSIRQVVAADALAKRGVRIAGQIILGNSIFLQETSRRTNNIISTAVSLPVLALTAAYHGKADMHGKSSAAFLDEVYGFALGDYLMALSHGYDITDGEAQRVAARLASYTGIPASYYLSHRLTVSKQAFNTMLVPGKVLNASDTRKVSDPVVGAPSNPEDAYAPIGRLYDAYMRDRLGVTLAGLQYRAMAPGAFDRWDWGSGCNDYLKASGLCSQTIARRTIFADYDWPERLKRQFDDPKFRTLVVASYYDGLSSIGTQRYLQTQLGYPKERFVLREYAAGHATADDPQAQPLVAADIRAFLLDRR